MNQHTGRLVFITDWRNEHVSCTNLTTYYDVDHTHKCLVCMDNSAHLMNLQFIRFCNTHEIYRFRFSQCAKDNIHIKNISNGCYPQHSTK